MNGLVHLCNAASQTQDTDSEESPLCFLNLLLGNLTGVAGWGQNDGSPPWNFTTPQRNS